jgi:hypothetical protein
MQVLCNHNTGAKLSKRYLETSGATRQSEYSLSIKKAYTVFSITIDNYNLYLLLSDEYNVPNFFPAELFSITDASIPDDWQFTAYPDDEEYLLKASWGYEYLIQNESHFDNLAEREPEDLAIFAGEKERRLKETKKQTDKKNLLSLRVTCKNNTAEGLSQQYLSSSGDTSETKYAISINKEYPVFAMCVSKNNIQVLLVDENQMPSWFPVELFSITNPTLPAEWFFSAYTKEDAALQAIFGYEHIVKDAFHYKSLLERDETALRIFQKEKFRRMGT